MMNKKITEAFDNIRPDDFAKNRVYHKFMHQRQKQKRSVFKTAMSFAAAAAVICLCLVGNNIINNKDIATDNLNPINSIIKTANSFTLTAYAAEIEEDGTVTAQKQIEFNQASSDMAYGIIVSTNTEDNSAVWVYKNIALKCHGTNISEVIFEVDKGHFVILNGDRWSALEELQKTYTLNKQDIANGNVVLWGGSSQEDDLITQNDGAFLLNDVVIKATVTFEDGEVQEKSILFNVQNGTLTLIER